MDSALLKAPPLPQELSERRIPRIQVPEDDILVTSALAPMPTEDEVNSELQKIKDKAELYSNQVWRLNNIYKIRDKQGAVIEFCMNAPQEELYTDMWYLNVVLKARQLGFSTFIDIFILDTCLFNPNIHAGIIAHHKDDANAIFEEKIKFPYESLNPVIRSGVNATTDRAGEIKFSNGSSIRVSTSFRSGTLQILHVSELGKIAAKFPEKAKEIRTGAFEAVAQGQMIFVESTAEGREGDFYNMVTKAKNMHDSHSTLTLMDFKFFFFPWHHNPEYRMDPGPVIFTREDQNYFHELEGQGIHLDREQQAWWIKKHEVLGEEIYREHPSFPEEAFKASVEGAYYGKTITDLRRQGRIANVPYEASFPVYTSWDLGMNDSMTIWFFQAIGREIRIIDYLEDSGENLSYYAKILAKKPYSYMGHYLPHDVGVRDLSAPEGASGTKSRETVLRDLGVKPITKVARPKNAEQLLSQIEETRTFLARAWIDETKCDKGIKCLENYRKEWDEKLGTFKKTPLHNWASHGADGLRTAGVGFNTVIKVLDKNLTPEATEDY